MVDALTVIKGAGYLKDRLDERLAKKQEDWFNSSLAEFAQVGGTVAIALLSLALHREPLEDEVQEFLVSLVEGPSGPARVRRLLGELLMSPSRKRRARLAAVFFAGPGITSTPDDRDRLDILVARLLDDDVEALRQLAGLEENKPDGGAERGANLGFLIGGRDGLPVDSTLRVCSIAVMKRAPSVRSLEDWSGWLGFSRIVVNNLEAAGLVQSFSTFSDELPGGKVVMPYEVSPLGHFLLTSLNHEAVCQGVAVIDKG